MAERYKPIGFVVGKNQGVHFFEKELHLTTELGGGKGGMSQWGESMTFVIRRVVIGETPMYTALLGNGIEGMFVPIAQASTPRSLGAELGSLLASSDGLYPHDFDIDANPELLGEEDMSQFYKGYFAPVDSEG